VKNLAIIRDSVIESLSNYFPSDDYRLDDLFIEDKIIDIRSELIKQYIEASKRVPIGFYQKILCIELKCKNAAECVTGFPHPSIVWYFETPSIISDNIKGVSIKYLGGLDMLSPFKPIGLSTFGEIGLSGLLYHPNITYYTYSGVNENGQHEILVKNPPTGGSKYFGMIALFADPISAAQLCNTSHTDEFIPREYIYKIELLVKKDILSTLGIPLDKINNATDNTTDGQIRQDKSE
jgi:hypothetical protein